MREIYIALTLLATAMAGCFGGSDSAFDPSATDDGSDLPVLPKGLEMEGADVVAYNTSTVLWRWTGTVGPGVGQGPQGDRVGVEVTASFDVPPRLAYALQATITWNGLPTSLLGLKIADSAEEVLCATPALLDPYHDPEVSCTALPTPSHGESRASATVETYAAEPDVEFTVLIQITIGARQDVSARPAGTDSASQTSPAENPHVVIGFADTGINPYHEAFRDVSPEAYLHPSTYIDGYPEDARALNLTLDAPSYVDALGADADTWHTLEKGVLYWIPGTKIIGATMPEEPQTAPGVFCRPVLDCNHHGTAVASRAAGTDLGLCAECKVVMVQGFQTGLEWIAEKDWVDVALLSYRYDLTEGRMGDRAEDEALIARKPMFVPSGNAAGADSLIVGLPTILSHWQGLPSVISVAAHDNGRLVVWSHSIPHLAADGYTLVAPHEAVEGARVMSGTSFAAPYAAGAGAKVILEARRVLGDVRGGVHDDLLAQGTAGKLQDGPLADGELTLDEFKRVLFTTAEARPEEGTHDGPACEPTREDVQCLLIPATAEWKTIPEDGAQYYLMGYGAVNERTLEHAKRVLRGEEPMPERPVEDAFFALDQEVRKALVGVDP